MASGAKDNDRIICTPPLPRATRTSYSSHRASTGQKLRRPPRFAGWGGQEKESRKGPRRGGARGKVRGRKREGQKKARRKGKRIGGRWGMGMAGGGGGARRKEKPTLPSLTWPTSPKNPNATQPNTSKPKPTQAQQGWPSPTQSQPDPTEPSRPNPPQRTQRKHPPWDDGLTLKSGALRHHPKHHHIMQGFMGRGPNE